MTAIKNDNLPFAEVVTSGLIAAEATGQPKPPSPTMKTLASSHCC